MSDPNEDNDYLPVEGEDGEGAERAEDYDEEDDIEDEEELIRNIGDNPLMERVQVALFKQLTLAHNRISMELRDVEEDSRRTKHKREDIGVSLYAVQQQLAKLQMELEDSHNHYNAITSIRSKAENDLGEVKVHYDDYKKEIESEQGKLEKNQLEIDALSATLRQVELYNEEMKSEIAVTRRATYKAEENVGQLEKSKQRQDLYIDGLNEQIRQLHDQLALYEAQLVSQRQETGAAKETLGDAAKEMGSIEFEKQQLMQQWKSSLIGMQRRDEALQATHDAIRQQREGIRSTISESEGYKAETTKCQHLNEVLMGRKERLDHATTLVEDQLKTVSVDQQKLAERYAMLKRSLEQTDKECSRLLQEGENIREQVKAEERNVDLVERERQTLQEQIDSFQGDQTTADKAARNLAKAASQIRGKVHEKEVEQAQMENELARIRVDCLNTAAHDKQLRETLEKLVTDLKEKDALIEKYEMEIRQRNDEVEKKMHVVDRLNRKYEALVGSQPEEENLGPLEATIKNTIKMTESKESENRELERVWLRYQTDLVKVVSDMEAESSQLHQLTSRETILQQKALRVDASIESQHRELKGLRSGIRGMHTDMSKLNELLSKNKELQDNLANENFVTETDFVSELKELEEDSVRMDHRVEKFKAEKAELLESIMESEKQIMLWERKIQLEKETQAALDPTVGESEASSMEKEIHRMKLRFETLKRDQERMIKEMERAIMKRESISLSNRGKKGKGLTKAGLKKKLGSERKKMESAQTEAQQIDSEIKAKLDDSENVGMELEKASNGYSQMEDEANNLQKAINNSLYEKQRNLDVKTKMQRQEQRYRDLSDPAAEQLEVEHVERVLGDAEQLFSSTKEVIDSIAAEHPHLKEVLDRVENLLAS